MIEIIRASAGSGKTFRLAKTYIQILLDAYFLPDPSAPEGSGPRRELSTYAHTLAVTFTNKATAEMKERIVKELDILASDPEQSDFYKDFSKRYSCSVKQLSTVSGLILSRILNDYSHLSISTIDAFFQSVLRSLAREMGRFNSYRLEIDSDAVMDAAVDDLLMNVKDNDPLVLFLSKHQRERLKLGESFDPVGYLKKTAGKLRSNFMGCHTKDYDFVKEATVDQLIGISMMSEDLLEKKYGVSGDELVALKKTLDAIRPALPILYAASRIFHAFESVSAEGNVMCIDEAGRLLHDLISGSSTPFIYERTGSRFDHFLIDEFQDTSQMQWLNFYPLLLDSIARGGHNLVVGDVKQSIYRWRNSDWTLLQKTLPSEFSASETFIDTLEDNYRSKSTLVDFVRDLFPFLAESIDSIIRDSAGSDTAAEIDVKGIYSDVRQNVKKGEGGFVEFLCCAKGYGEIDATVRKVQEIHDMGVDYGDILILLRGNDEISDIADSLLKAGIGVFTDEFLHVDSDPLTLRLLGCLRYLDNPKDKISEYLVPESMRESIAVSHDSRSLVDLCEDLVRKLLLRTCEDGSCVYDRSQADRSAPYLHSLMDAVKDYESRGGNSLHDFLRNFDPSACKVFCPKSKDSVSIMTVHKAKGLAAEYVIVPYLEKIDYFKHADFWRSADARLDHIVADNDEMSILAKGPFLVHLSAKSEGTFFAESYRKEFSASCIDSLNILYVALTRARKGMTLICDCPSESFQKQLYSAVVKGDVSEQKLYMQTKNFSHLLLYYLMKNCHDAKIYLSGFGKSKTFDSEQDGYVAEYLIGEKRHIADSDKNEDERQKITLLQCGYPLTESQGKLRENTRAKDFYLSDMIESVRGRRHRGVVLHDILSSVVGASDLALAVEVKLQEGVLAAEDRDEALKYLAHKLRKVEAYGWFDETLDPCDVLRESEILAPEPIVNPKDESKKDFLRPDRVIVDRASGKATVIDFKFGRKKDEETFREYEDQVKSYCELYRNMGFSSVRGYIWWVALDKVDEID